MNTEKRKIGRPRTLPDLVCEQCGTAFRPHTGRSRFCSRPCSGAWHSVHGTHRAIKDAKICPACGKTFYVGGMGSRRSRKFCSAKCSGKQRSPIARTLTRTERAWLAGLFDGEGSIVLAKAPDINSVRISITNTHLPLLEHVLVTTGTGAIINHHPARGRHAQSWYWQCYASNARSLLRQMLPWLIVKREKAEEALRPQTRVRIP